MGATALGVQTNPAASHLPPVYKGVRPEGEKLLAFPEAGTRRRRSHLLEAVNHEEDVGVADLGLLPFAVHGVFTGGRKHLLKERRFKDGVRPPCTQSQSHSAEWNVLSKEQVTALRLLSQAEARRNR